MAPMLSAPQIVDALGGTNAAARFFGVKPPSVTEWLRNGVIPEDKLLRRAAVLEQQVPGFTRQGQFPEVWSDIWPELRPPKLVPKADIH